MCVNIDSQRPINVTKSSAFHERCNHIDIKNNFIKEKYSERGITLKYVSTNNKYADMFTKAPSQYKF